MNIVEPRDLPEHIPYLELEDYFNRELLRADGFSLADDELVSVLDNGDVVLEAAAIHTLGSGSHHAALSHLKEKLKSDEDLLQVEAAYALARMNQEEGLATLLKCLERPIDAYISAPLAAGYLARLGDASGYDVVARSLALGLSAIRMIACKQITCFVPFHGSETPTGESVDIYRLARKALADPHVSIGWQALVQLAWMDSEEAYQLLQDCAGRSEHADFRRLAQRALDGDYGLADTGRGSL